MEDWMVLLAGARRVSAREGEGLELRLLSAWEVMEARREAQGLAQEDQRESALCANACLLARALERESQPVFEHGRAVLDGLSVEQIGSLCRQWSELTTRENPSAQDGEERVQTLKKAWSTRLMAACSGVCSEGLGHFLPRSGPSR